MTATCTTPPEPRFYRPELDSLRFFAFLLVFFAHTAGSAAGHHLPHFLERLGAAISSGGSYGVDLFFLLSAYLITTLFLKEKERVGAVDVRRFYIRRILRIWPLYFAFTFFTFLLARIDTSQAFGWMHVMSFVFMVGNWGLIFGLSGASVASILWSVSVEEQFYLTWPLFARSASPWQIRNYALAMIVIAWIARIIVTSAALPTEYLWGNTFCHFDSIGVGVILAVWLHQREWTISLPARIALACSALAGYGIVGVMFDLWAKATPGFAITLPAFPIAILASTAIFLAVYSSSFHWRPLVYLGKISYGLYVYHILAIYLTKKALVFFAFDVQRPGVAISDVLFAFAVTVALAAISYRWLESPFLRMKEHFTEVSSRPV